MSKATSIRKKVYTFLIIVAVLLVSGSFVSRYVSTAWGSAEAKSIKDKKKTDPDDVTIPVELAVAATGEISSYVTATANVRALRDVDILSQSEGRVEEMAVEEGDFVRKGQLLCRLDDRQLQIQLRSAQQKLAQAGFQSEKAESRRAKAQTQIRNSRDELNRYEKLYAAKLVSQREVAQQRYRIDELTHDERTSAYETRELGHRIDELQAEIAQVHLQIAQTRIRAPFSGLITERAIDLGQTVRKLDRLFKLGDFSPLLADVFVSEREAQLVHPGQAASVSLGVDRAQQLKGRVVRISPIVDQSTGTVKITIELGQGDDLFKPGAFVQVDIQTDTHSQSVLIPKRAIIEEDGQQYVFVAEDEKTSRQKVTLGYESNGQVEVLEGLSSGQKVVVAGQGGLKEGSKIKVTES
ncbi:MAG: efflux RND transporter periplasmic adaptor subunit [Acidobacteriota bacterium]